MIRGLGYALSAIAVFAVMAGCDAIQPLPGEQRTIVLEAGIFEGGYGIHWHTQVAEEFAALHPDLEVDLWGDPRISEKLKPRLLRGDPPDFVLEQRLPMWLLIVNNKLLPFNETLDKTAYGTGVRWGDLFIPGTLSRFMSDGNVYALPSALGVWACWYDARLFREHGWEIPSTWDEFQALCRDIQAAGIAPLAFQGKYPLYSWWTYMTLVQRCGGLAAINRVNALEEGAFSHPDALWAAQLLQDMALEFFQPGAMAMTHTESQLQFVNNQAAMIFCGVWLENEMKASTPPAFEMRCFNLPAVTGGKGNPNLCNGSGSEFIFIPADGRYPEQAFEFARFMVSPERAPSLGAQAGILSPLRGATPMDAVSPALQSVLKAVHASPGIFSDRLDTLLLEWTTQVMVPGLAALLRGEITPEEFGARMDAGIVAAKANPDVFVPEYTPYDPADYGESP